MNQKNSLGLNSCFLDLKDPIQLFKVWMDEAKKTEPNDPNAVALATSNKKNLPSVRMVLLKDFNENGFVFYTNLNSQKGIELKENPNASMCFHWKSLLRQVRISGSVSLVSDKVADQYYNTRGYESRIGAWGESHGPAIGCIVDGCPPNIYLKEHDIQKELDKRKPGQSKFTTQRKEDDKVQILSGVFDGKTTGTPISMIIYNKDMRSKDYGNIKDKFRPGHADLTYFKKYGIRDYRGGGRSSARETASRVAAGAIAKIVLQKKLGKKFQVIGAVTQLGILGCDTNEWNDKIITKNPFFCPDKSMIKIWEKYLLGVRKSGSSCGAIIEIRARGIPAGLGAPIYSKLDSDIASSLMSINAVKGVNIGSGLNSAQLSGEQSSDEIFQKGKKLKFNSNNAGGILGGISSGQEIIASFAVKPTSSILTTRKTINKFGKNTTISVKGRHDPCVGIRAVPVGEAMMNCVLLDHYLMNKAQCS